MALTTAQLAVALRIIGAATETVPAGPAAVITRQASVARALVTAHAPGAPEDVADEAVIRLVGFLYDQSPGMPRANNAMVASGAGAILAPWHVARLILPTGSGGGDGDGAAVVALDGPSIVAALTALQGGARLPATAIRDLPSGGGGGGLTADERAVLEAAVVIGDDTPSLSGATLSFATDGGDGRTINLGGITHPQPEAADTGRVLKATGPATSDWQTEAAALPENRKVPTVGAGDVGRILTAPQRAGGQPTWNSNPGQTAVQVAAAVKAGVADWAESGDGSRLPEAKLPAKADDFLDAITLGGWGNSLFGRVSSHWSSVAKPSNPEESPFVYVSHFEVSPRQVNVFAVIQIPRATGPSAVKVATDELRLVVTDSRGALLSSVGGADWTFLESVVSSGVNYLYYTAAIADAPVGATVRVQEFAKITFDADRIATAADQIATWARTGNTAVIPRAKIPPSEFVTQMVNQVRGITIARFNGAVRNSLNAFQTPLTLTSADHGVLLVAIQASVHSGSSTRALLSVRPDEREASKLLYLSVLRASTADGGTGSDGLEVASFDVWNTVPAGTTGAFNRGVKQGTITCRIARNAANQVGTYARYEPESGAVGTAGPQIVLDWEVTLLRTDATAAAPAPDVTGAQVVSLLSALQGSARLPAAAVQGVAALTVQTATISLNTNQFVSTGITFDSADSGFLSVDTVGGTTSGSGTRGKHVATVSLAAIIAIPNIAPLGNYAVQEHRSMDLDFSPDRVIRIGKTRMSGDPDRTLAAEFVGGSGAVNVRFTVVRWR